MFNAFLKIHGVEGEAVQSDYEGQIALHSFNLGATNPGEQHLGGGGRATGRAKVSDFTASKLTDKASPILFQACCLGKHFPNAQITVCKATGDRQDWFLKYNFDTVFITDLQWAGGGGDDTPLESFSMSFSKIEVTYRSQDIKGNVGEPVVASYDIATGLKA